MNMPIIKLAEVLALNCNNIAKAQESGAEDELTCGYSILWPRRACCPFDHTKCADVTKEHWLETIFEHLQPSL